MSSSHTTNGYQQLGNFMIQWGQALSSSDNSQSFSFPTSFASACWFVGVTVMDANFKNYLPVTGFSATGFTINRHSDLSNKTFCWIAIGDC